MLAEPSLESMPNTDAESFFYVQYNSRSSSQPSSAKDSTSELTGTPLTNPHMAFVAVIIIIGGLGGVNTQEFSIEDGAAVHLSWRHEALIRRPHRRNETKEWLFTAPSLVDAVSQPRSFYKFSGDNDQTPGRKQPDDFLQIRLKRIEDVLASREWL